MQENYLFLTFLVNIFGHSSQGNGRRELGISLSTAAFA